MQVSNVVASIFSLTNDMLQRFVFQGFAAVSSMLHGPVISAAVIASAIACCYILYKPQAFKSTLYTWALTLSVVMFFTFSWAHTSQLLYQLFTQTPVNFINEVVTHLGISLPNNSIEGGLQGVMSQLDMVMQAFWALGHLTNLEPYFFAFVTLILTILLMVIAIFELLWAQIGLAINFVLAPFFIPCALFKFTKPMSHRWLSRSAGMALTIVFVNLMLVLVLKLCQASLQEVIDHIALNQPVYFSLLIPFFILGSICVGLIYKVAQEAQLLASGMGSSSGFEGATTGMAAVAGVSGTSLALKGGSRLASNVGHRAVSHQASKWHSALWGKPY